MHAYGLSTLSTLDLKYQQQIIWLWALPNGEWFDLYEKVLEGQRAQTLVNLNFRISCEHASCCIVECVLFSQWALVALCCCCLYPWQQKKKLHFHSSSRIVFNGLLLWWRDFLHKSTANWLAEAYHAKTRRSFIVSTRSCVVLWCLLVRLKCALAAL